jgi:hypothetical protein
MSSLASLFLRLRRFFSAPQQVALFFKSRARVEEAYARSLTEMGRDLMDNYHKGDGKAGSFFKAYQDTLRIHDLVAAKRTGFANHLNEMSEELTVLAKEMEKTRKQHKDTGTRFERNLQEADLTMEKVRPANLPPIHDRSLTFDSALRRPRLALTRLPRSLSGSSSTRRGAISRTPACTPRPIRTELRATARSSARRSGRARVCSRARTRLRSRSRRTM